MKVAGLLALVGLASLGVGCHSVESPLHPIVPPAGYKGPFTESFSSDVAVAGRSTRSFIVEKDGVVTLTLLSAGPPSTVVIGLGLGIPRVDGTGCNLSTTVNTQAGSSPQITATVDAGTYCLSVFDLGTLSSMVSFSVTIFHP